ncbi:MAG: hypothetical protein AB4352_14280 [Hormoscilla sp.]
MPCPYMMYAIARIHLIGRSPEYILWGDRIPTYGAGARRDKHFKFSRSSVDAVPLHYVCDRINTFDGAIAFIWCRGTGDRMVPGHGDTNIFHFPAHLWMPYTYLYAIARIHVMVRSHDVMEDGRPVM